MLYPGLGSLQAAKNVRDARLKEIVDMAAVRPENPAASKTVPEVCAQHRHQSRGLTFLIKLPAWNLGLALILDSKVHLVQ